MTRIRREEMLALTHHSFVAHTLPTTGGAVLILQRIDPRTKLLSLLGLLVVTNPVHSMVTPVGLFVKRVWLFVPTAPRSLGVPRICALIIGIACRYIFQLSASEKPTI